MASCKFCGEPVGFLRFAHKECVRKHDEGWARMLELAADTCLGKAPKEGLKAGLESIAASSYVDQSKSQEAIIKGWEQGAAHYLEDGSLAESEERQLHAYTEYFSLSQDHLDSKGAYSRVVKSAVLRDVMNGAIPDAVKAQGALPFNLQKNEKLIWLFTDTKYYEERKQRQYRGGHHGMSFRIAKGVYYRVGAFQGQPVDTSETVLAGTGLLGVTNRHIYFSGNGRSFRIRHDKVVTIEPYEDGVGIQRDAQTARPQVFVTGDGWFTYNLLTNVARL